MSKPVHIRKAKPSDADSLATLCITVWIDTYCMEGIEAPLASYVLSEYSADSLKKRVSEKTVLVAESKASLLGLAVLDDGTGEIETLYVLPRFKGLGVGRLLVEELKNHSSSPLFLTCWEGNQAALRFYDRLGFVETGETCFELDGKKHRNIRLQTG
ncbi:MAG: GNAT family N-acetyltransferase [Natronospirillum sp.]|uniref:GNAT family N-acetyltransferase n=1 Tax=Natronospirillum sp. TaxID=2812955 RepID=UPI0025EAB60A|nr:GNAT family N-acetyltransferase [Natronospirillum sp.]MCH8552117.1 GNAT family N-acetyltransferase [Natronospirillum sp.]